MNRSSSSMAPVLNDFHQREKTLRSKILKNEQERIDIDLKLKSLTTIDNRLKQREQIEHIQSIVNQHNHDSQRTEQRNLQLLNDITQAEQHLLQLRTNVEHVIRLKYDYLQYLESNYPHWQKRVTVTTTTDAHYDQSLSESTSGLSFSRSARGGSLRMELSRTGLNFLLDYLEKQLHDTIDNKKFYHHDEPTISQKRQILDIANDQQRNSLDELEPTTTSMVIVDQLPSTIRRTTVNKCLLNEDILSANVIDLDRDSILRQLPEQDRSLWIRLVDHFTRLVKNHIMTAENLANRFAPLLLPSNVFFLHEKAKSVLKHVIEKQQIRQPLSSDDETSHSIARVPPKTSSWLNKLTTGVDDDDDSSLLTPKKATTSKGNDSDSDDDFFY